MSSFALEAYLEERRRWVEEALDRFLPPADAYPSVIHEAMRYSVFAGGKRLRGILVIAGAEAVGSEAERCLAVASAIELIHAYSLIHDDLPGMDNSDFRRGQPACHKRFGEAVALLAGDALLTLAFSVVAREPLAASLGGERLGQVLQEIAQASGTEGMIGGQTMDILAQGKEVDPSLLRYIHTHKTGALIRASVRSGGLLAGASPSELAALTDYGERIGLAFQIADDILDITGLEAEMGKELNKDREKGKATYPGLFGLEASEREAKRLTDEAIGGLALFGEARVQPLAAIAAYVIHRRN